MYMYVNTKHESHGSQSTVSVSGICPTHGRTYSFKGLRTQLAIFQLCVYVLDCSPPCSQLLDD